MLNSIVFYILLAGFIAFVAIIIMLVICNKKYGSDHPISELKSLLKNHADVDIDKTIKGFNYHIKIEEKNEERTEVS